MDDTGGGGGGAVAPTTGIPCAACGTNVSATAKFCSECGAPVTQIRRSAEYKQVTVLFADVVHSMDIAATVGAERLREIMTELADRCAAVVRRFGGTVASFTGDGIMAVFGAPAALEDHAVRACLAALAIQQEAKPLAVDAQDRDGIELKLRVGLNSGEVIAGEIGSGPFGYTAVGEQVGMAQRMESVAPPGGVMLSASTARLVAGAVDLGEPEMVSVKGSAEPVRAQRLLAVTSERQRALSTQSTLVGRELELHTMTGLLERAMSGRGVVVGVVGPPGIGKSRLLREITAIAESRGVTVISSNCESHGAQVPFHAVAQMMRKTFRVSALDGGDARARLREQRPDIDPDDLLLWEDLLGIADPSATLPRIDPDARRRRLAALINAANLRRTHPALYILEDVHWIDEASESMMADVLAVIGQTYTMSVSTYRSEYQGALTRVHGAHTIALTPLTDSETSGLLGELLGPDPSVGDVAATVVSRVGGNPFFAEEMVRELAQSGQLDGERGGYICQTDVADVTVPATVQATIAARIDRLNPVAKRTLSAAAVIGLRFSADLLTRLGADAAVEELVAAELIDQVRFTQDAEYAFHHPLIRAVAYESQLKSDRAEWHRRVAAVIETSEPDAAAEHAALIAEHLEAAGEFREAYGWHMRAGSWSTRRDIAASRTSWERARRIADALPDNEPECTTMRIGPRVRLCGSAWRGGLTNVAGLVDELRELCARVDDDASLAVGITALTFQLGADGQLREAFRLASEQLTIFESVEDPTTTIGAAAAAASVLHQSGHAMEVLRWSQSVIDWAGENSGERDDRISRSPLIALAWVFRGMARWCLGHPGWRQDLDDAGAMAPKADPVTHPSVVGWRYLDAISHGVLRADDQAVRELEGALRIAEASGEDTSVGNLKYALGRALVERDSSAERERGMAMLGEIRDMCVNHGFFMIRVPVLDFCAARQRARVGDFDDSIPVMRRVTDDLLRDGQVLQGVWILARLAETMLGRGSDTDIADAQDVVESMANLADEVGGAIRDIWLLRLRTLLALARGDQIGYRDYRDRYRAMAASLGFEGHMDWAGAMA